MNLQRQLNSVGKAIFVKYYYYFSNSNYYSTEVVIKIIKENYSKKSKKSRISHAHMIFNNNLSVVALKIILKSKVPEEIKQQAQNILEEILP